jgi:hypothetical protein
MKKVASLPHPVFMHVAIREHRTLTLRFLDVAKFTTLTPLSLLISYAFSFPLVGI